MTQMVLPLYGSKAPPPNPNAWMFNADGTPKRLLWCSDEAREGGPCPHEGKTNPRLPCCKELVTEVAPVTVEVGAYDPSKVAIPY